MSRREVMACVLLVVGFLPAACLAASVAGAPVLSETCDCDRFVEALAAAEALYASRGDGVTVPLDDDMHARFRTRVDRAYDRARCLAACSRVPELERNAARLLVAATSFKTAGLPDSIARERLRVGLAAAESCLAVEPANTLCHMWHASTRGILARGTWNPLQLRLPAQLLAEFRTARAGLPPGRDALEGAATRGEASLLLKIPVVLGGDPQAGRRLLEEAAGAPGFACRVANRLLLAEALARTGEPARALEEVRATVAAGLPSCSSARYENALTLEEAERCRAHLERAPEVDPGWDDDCR